MNTITTTLIICITILLGFFFLSKTSFTIKDASTTTQQGNAIMNSIVVQGEGKVFAQPDIFILNVSISHLAATTAEAQQKTKADVTKLLALIKSKNILEKDIQTTDVSLSPEYDYNSIPNKIKGYRANHGLILKIRKLEQIDQLINEVTTISNEVQIGSMSYDIDDKTTLYSEARKLAFAKAKQKAEELAQLGAVKLSKPISISDQIQAYPIYGPMPMLQENVYRTEAADMAVGGAALINPGQLEVNVMVNIVYGIE